VKIMVWPYAWPSAPRPAAKKARTYQANMLATAAAPDTINLPLPRAGKITRVEVDAAAVTEYFKYVDAWVRSPLGGFVIRVASGQLLPQRDARLVEHQETHIQANSILKANFYTITAGTRIYVTVNIVEE